MDQKETTGPTTARSPQLESAAQIIASGPFAVFSMGVLIILFKADSIPESVIVNISSSMPWLLLVLVFMWLFVKTNQDYNNQLFGLNRQHLGERKDLVESLSKNNNRLADIVERNTMASANLTLVIEELRKDLERQGRIDPKEQVPG